MFLLLKEGFEIDALLCSGSSVESSRPFNETLRLLYTEAEGDEEQRG